MNLKLDLNLSDYSKFLDLLRKLRNSVYNMGVYIKMMMKLYGIVLNINLLRINL